MAGSFSRQQEQSSLRPLGESGLSDIVIDDDLVVVVVVVVAVVVVVVVARRLPCIIFG